MTKYNTKEHTCAICGVKFTGRKKKYCSTDCSNEARRKRNRERWRKQNPGWNDGREVTKECEWCGEQYQVIKRYAYQSQYCSDECRQERYSREVRGHGPAEEDRARREKQKEQRKEKLKRGQHQRYLERLTVKECEWCGGEFETDIPSQVTCSDECRRKRRNRLASIRSDKRINENNLVDADITLERLFERDEGICYICNTPCHYDDKTITDEGYFIAGSTYPSIDHVYPLARGGMHSWDNVRLSHHSCNGEKSDNLAEGVEPLSRDVAYSQARKISPRMKITLQFNTKGKLVGTYESTAQAEIETGVKRKGIQNCARGECKTYGGYVWEYA